MNEVSNGPSGNQEYVEFVVVDTSVSYNCASTTPPCIDIRGWIFDDNSGYHGTSGIAAGAVRFSFNSLWSCVPLGTIIVIYNNADPNVQMPANDLSLTDGNCVIVAPISNTSLFEQNTTTPGAVACSYPATGWTAGGNWNFTLLANPGDCARIVNLAGCEVFSVCWGSDNLNTLIYFNSGGSGSQNVWYFNDGNPSTQANWSEGSAAAGGNQTPGAPNNAANAAYIAQFNNNCAPITPISVTATSVNAGCTCTGTATATATGSIPGYTYLWVDASFTPIGQTTATATGLCAGTYHVIATSDIGCSDTATVTITSTSAPTVNVTSQTICQGTSASLTATGSPAGGTFSWSPGGLTTASITISPATTTNYTVTYTLAGCSANATGTVTVNPLPAPIITGTTTYCAGSNVSLSTTTPFTSYSWSTGSSAATINATAANNPLTVTVTNAAGCQATSPAINLVENGVVNANSAVSICQGESMLIHGVLQTVAGTYSQTFTLASGCDSTSNVTLTVNPLPTIDAGLDQTICAGTSVTLTASGGVNYTWDNGVTNGLAFNPSVSTTYTVLGTNAAGCVASDQVLVTVNPLPSVDAGPDQQLCAGTSVQLTASGASAFTWDNGIVDGVSFVPVSTTTYTVTGTSVDGCVKSDQVTVTVNPLPTVFAGNDISICSGQSITLSGQGATSYSWDNGVQNGVPFIPTLGTSTYTVTGTSAAGCIASDDVLVSVGTTSTVSFLTDTTSGCSPLPVNLTNTTAGASNCVWTLSDGTILSGCGTVSTSLLTPGCYDVTLTSTFSNGCVGTLTMPNLICVDPNPIASFTPSTATITEEISTVYFHNTSSNASDYLWDFGDHLSISTAIDPTHDYGQDALGNYMITLVAYSPAGCTDTAYSLIRYEEDLIFYVPNAFTPDDDEFNQLFQPVFTSGFDPFDFSMLIFNRWGEIVFETHDATIGWDGTYGANSQNRLAEDGTYTWKIEFKTSKNDERKLVVGHVNMLH